ncbi:MAG TPA: hypothetical protein VK509_13655 [Polyangiales bacterium]|nr:hypothetical protein [Polyangiales bacterium]
MSARASSACWLLVAGLAGCGGENVVLGDGRDGGRAPGPHDAGDTRDAGDAGDAGALRDAGGARDGAIGRDASLPIAPAFMPPRAIAEISGEDTTDDDPSLSSDRLLLYFNSRRDGGLGREDIWFAARDDAAAPWQAPTALPELNSDARETGIALAGDGLQLWWSSDREGGQGGLDVYRATRATRADAWSAPEPVAELSSPGDDLVSALSSDGAILLLARRDDEDDDYDLYGAARSPTAAFAAPEPLTELNSDDEESDGFLLGNGLQLIFTRDGDLMLAERPTRAAPFGAAVELATLNSEEDDRDAWSSDTLDYVVFSSDRTGSYLLYEATR